MYDLDSDIKIIDTPGIRGFGLIKLQNMNWVIFSEFLRQSKNVNLKIVYT